MVNLITDSSLSPEDCSLSITDMKDICGERFDTKGCTIFLVQSGFAAVKINYQRYALRRGSVGVLFYDDIVFIERVSRSFKCIVLSLAYSIVESVIYKVTTSGLWNFIYNNPVFLLNDKQIFTFGNWWDQLIRIVNYTKGNFRFGILKNSIHNFFIVVESELHYSGTGAYMKEDNRARLLVTNFLDLVAAHHLRHRDVQFYADKLCIDTSYLYKLTFKVLSASPKKLIDLQVTRAIKNLLINTDLTVKNIATELQFSDASYMSKFFTRLEGISPANYRIKMGKQ